MDEPRLTDALGTRHAPAGEGARIVSLVPSLTELLFDLGLGAQVVGRTRYCVHPADRVAAVPGLGGTKKIRLDRLRALAPTHVLVNIDENTRATADAVAEIVPHVVVTHPLDPADNPGLYRLIGGLFGREAEAEALCGCFQRAYDALRLAARSLPARRVLYLVWKDPWMTVSRETYISRMLALVNWRTVGDDPERRYPRVDIDAALAESEVVLLPSEPYAFAAADAAGLEARRPGIDVRLIDGEMVSWYGSRAIAGLGYLGRFAAAERSAAGRTAARTDDAVKLK